MPTEYKYFVTGPGSPGQPYAFKAKSEKHIRDHYRNQKMPLIPTTFYYISMKELQLIFLPDFSDIL